MNKIVGWASFIGFLATIPVANAWLEHFGFWDVPILGPVASGVIWVGFAFVLRDIAQLVLGQRWVWAAICCGALLTWWLASPSLAIASCVAFFVSETLDAMIYTPLADRHFVKAVFASGFVGSFVDSFLFVMIAFHSSSGWWQLGLVKACIVAVTTPVAYWARNVVSNYTATI